MDAFVRKYNLLILYEKKIYSWKVIKNVKISSKVLVQMISQLIFQTFKKWIISVLSI